MTTTTRTHAPNRRWAGLLLAALAAVLAFVLPSSTASASGVPAAQTRVGASHPAVVHIVGVAEHIAAGQHLGRAPSQLQLVSGHCVAEESGVIYRTGSRTEGALTDSSGVSFRDSVSSSASAEHPQVFRPGDKIWGVDTAKLPPGSVVRDGTPAGHVSVFATPEEINAAVFEEPFLANLGLKSLDEFGSFRIPK